MNFKKKADDQPMSSNISGLHPKVSEMILISIAMLNDRNGSSVRAITKYICQNFKVDEKKIPKKVKWYVSMLAASGTIIQTKGKGATGSFRLGGSMKLKMSGLLSKFSNDNKTASPSAQRYNGHDTASDKSTKEAKKTKSDSKISSRAV